MVVALLPIIGDFEKNIRKKSFCSKKKDTGTSASSVGLNI